MKTRLYFIVIAVSSTLLAFLWQEQNLNYLAHNFPDKIENRCVTTTDDASYLQPPIHWKETGVWKDGSQGNSAYFQRPPGYGMLYLVCSWLSPSNPTLILKWIQVVGFFFSILLVSNLLKLFELPLAWVYGGTMVYGLLPCYSGFLYHTITEGITPVLLLWSIYEWVLQLKGKGRSGYWIAANAFLLLVRPQLAIFSLVFILYLIFKKQWKKMAWFFLILLPFLAWQLRTISINGWTPTVHPIYAENNQSIYREPHRAFGELAKIWEYRSDHFHEGVALLYQDTSEAAVRKAKFSIRSPRFAFRRELYANYREYQGILRLQKEAMAKGELNHLLPEEIKYVEETEALTNQIVAKHLKDAYLKTPFNSSIELLLNSHLHLSIFQFKYRGRIWMEVIRWLCLLTILSGFISSLVLSVRRKKIPVELRLVVWSFTLSFLYLVYVQRLNEERYLTPFLPLLLIAGIWLLRDLVRRLKQFRS